MESSRKYWVVSPNKRTPTFPYAAYTPAKIPGFVPGRTAESSGVAGASLAPIAQSRRHTRGAL